MKRQQTPIWVPLLIAGMLFGVLGLGAAAVAGWMLLKSDRDKVAKSEVKQTAPTSLPPVVPKQQAVIEGKRKEDTEKSDKDLIASLDSICDSTAKAMAGLEVIVEAKAENEALLVEIEADPSEDKKLVKARMEAKKAEVRRSLHMDPSYILLTNEYAKNAMDFRKLLQRYPQWLAIYANRAWAKP